MSSPYSNIRYINKKVNKDQKIELEVYVNPKFYRYLLGSGYKLPRSFLILCTIIYNYNPTEEEMVNLLIICEMVYNGLRANAITHILTDIIGNQLRQSLETDPKKSNSVKMLMYLDVSNHIMRID